MKRPIPYAVVLLLLAAGAADAQDRDTKVRNDRKQLEATEGWIYNDLPEARAQAEKTGKPLLIVFRCIP